MFYLSRTVVQSDYYNKILLLGSRVCLVQPASVVLCNVSNGKFEWAETKHMHDVVRSAAVVSGRIVLAFDGRLVFLNRDLESVHGLEIGLKDTAYIASTLSSICLSSLFGSMLFIPSIGDEAAGAGAVSEFKTNATVLDLRQMGGLIYSLEKREDVVLVVYEETSGIVLTKAEMSVPRGYMVVPLGRRECLVLGSGRAYLVLDMEVGASYGLKRTGNAMKLTDELDDGGEGRIFTCHDAFNGAILICDEEGSLYKLEKRERPSFTHVGEIGPVKDIKVIDSAFLVTIGFNRNNCLYGIRDGILVLMDGLEVFGVCRSAALVGEGTGCGQGSYRLFVSDNERIREIVRDSDMKIVDEYEMTNGPDAAGEIMVSNGSFILVHRDVVHRFSVVNDRIVFDYKAEIGEEVVGYLRAEGDYLLLNDSIRRIDRAESCPRAYELFAISQSFIFLASRNEITKASSKTTESFKIPFAIRAVTASDSLLFVLTGSRILRIYDVEKRRCLLIQCYRFDVALVEYTDGFLYVVGERIVKHEVGEDGVLSIGVVVRNVLDVSRVVSIRGGLLRDIESEIFDVRSGKRWKNVTMARMEDKILIYENQRVKLLSGHAGSTYALDKGMRGRIFGTEYVEETECGFKARSLGNGDAILISGDGRVIDYSADGEHRGIIVENGRRSILLYKRAALLCEYPTEGELIRVHGGSVYVGTGDFCCVYEIGHRTLLRKYRIALPSPMTGLCFCGSRLFIGTSGSSVLAVEDRRITHADPMPRHVTALAVFGDGVIVGDGMGYLLVMDHELRTRAVLYLNDLPVSFTAEKERCFVVTASGKVLEEVRIEEKLFKILAEVENGERYFRAYRRINFVDAEHLKEVARESAVAKLEERTGMSAERMLELLNLI
jgi:hypothetical protein